MIMVNIWDDKHGGYVQQRRKTILALSASILLFALPSLVSASMVTTTLMISICGDAIVNPGEVCDDGLFNDAGYGSSTAQRHCNTTCSGYGPYCGDNIFQAYYGEGCDDGVLNGTTDDLCSLSCTQILPPVSTTTPTSTPPAPTTSGGGGGGGGSFAGNVPIRAQTKVSLLGKAYPGSTVNILKDGQVIGQAQADLNADFSYDLSSVTPGPTTFGFWATDSKGVRSITFTTTFQVTQNAVTTVSNVFLPPTLSLQNKKVNLGDIINALGMTAPGAKVSLFVDKEPEARAVSTSTADGSYNSALTTGELADEAFHAVKAMFEQFGTGAQAKSGYSQAVSFYVGTRDVKVPGTADLNNDGKVNLVDFSILLYHWGTDHAIADLNSDRRVNLTDFSILLFNWTG